MSISFGGSSNKSSSTGSFSGTDNTNQNTTFNQTGTQTTTPNNPDWVTNGASGLFTGAQQLASQNPQSYVAGPSGLQNTAATNATALNSNPNGIGSANAYDTLLMNNGAAPQTSAATASPYINSYMSPYLNDVVNASTAAFDNQAGQTRAQQSLDLAKSGAFGGSGAAITQGITEGQLALARGQLQSGLLNTGYQDAVTNAQQDAQRAQDANDLNANLHSQMQDRRLTAGNDLTANAATQAQIANQNVATQAGLGSTLQGIQQQQATAPLDLQAWLGQYYSGLPLSLFNGQTANTTQAGTQDETGTETQSGTQQSSGKNSGLSFGFSSKSS